MNSEFGHMPDEEIMRFIRDEMQGDELSSFEQQMSKDAVLREEVALQRSVYHSLNENSWDSSQTQLSDTIESVKKELQKEDLKLASQTIKMVGKDYAAGDIDLRKKSKISYKWLAVAATFLLLLTLPFLLKNDDQSFYASYEDWNNLPSFIEKGAVTNDLALGEQLYKGEKFSEVITHLQEEVGEDSSFYAASLVYLGASYYKLQNKSKALKVFDDLIATETLYSSYGYWYKLHIYLNDNDKENAQKMLDLVLSNQNNYNYSKALEIETRLGKTKKLNN